MRPLLLVSVLLLMTCRETPSGPPLERAKAADDRFDFREAAKLYEEALRGETDAKKRRDTELRLAHIEWRILGKVEPAHARLTRLAAHEELARVARERGDLAASRNHAEAALAAAKTKRERRRALLARATILVEGRRELPRAIADVRELMAHEGPMLHSARLLARAGLLANDGAVAMAGIDGYYHVSAHAGPPHLIANAHATLQRLLPSWRGGKNREIAEALAGIRFFDEAALLAAPDSDVAQYAAALERVEALTNAYYRDIALGRDDDDDLEDGIERELGDRFRRFGAYVNIGKTGGYIDLHMGHPVVDRELQVEQYGRRGKVRFIALDAIVSNGYYEWANDGRSGDGGWGTAKQIYQVRPRYADDPLRRWMRMTDPEMAPTEEVTGYRAVARRLEQQYLDSVYATHKTRDAFVAKVERDEFQYSIVLHEGRHAIDFAAGADFKTWELEYRAKVAAIALADAPRDSLASILYGPIDGDSPHGKGAAKLIDGLNAWMRTHAPAAKHYDELTDQQLRAAAASLRSPP